MLKTFINTISTMAPKRSKQVYISIEAYNALMHYIEKREITAKEVVTMAVREYLIKARKNIK